MAVSAIRADQVGSLLRPPELVEAWGQRGACLIAQPVLDEIVKEIEDRRLIEWEDGEALAYPLSLLFCCASDPERRQRLYAMVCRLDPVRALQMPV